VALAQLVREAARLHTLLLNDGAIHVIGMRALGEAVAQSTSLAVLSLNGMGTVGDGGALAIAAALKTSTSLQRVSLSRCWIGDTGAVALAAALRSSLPDSRLETLDLSYNVIEDDGATALVDAALGSVQCSSRYCCEIRASPQPCLRACSSSVRTERGPIAL